MYATTKIEMENIYCRRIKKLNKKYFKIYATLFFKWKI